MSIICRRCKKNKLTTTDINGKVKDASDPRQAFCISKRNGKPYRSYKDFKSEGNGAIDLMPVCEDCYSQRQINYEKGIEFKVPLGADWRGNWWTIALPIVLLILFANSSSQTPSKPDGIDALSYCQVAIKERLHNPKSLDYNIRDQSYSVQSLGGNKYDGFANGTFYAQNSFGATVKSRFFCNVLIDENNDTYRIKSLDIM